MVHQKITFQNKIYAYWECFLGGGQELGGRCEKYGLLLEFVLDI